MKLVVNKMEQSLDNYLMLNLFPQNLMKKYQEILVSNLILIIKFEHTFLSLLASEWKIQRRGTSISCSQESDATNTRNLSEKS